MAEKPLSPTKINVWDTCHLQFYFQYIIHASVAKSVNLIFGSEIHYMLQLFYKNNFKSADTFVNKFKYRWREIVAGNFLKGKKKRELEVTNLPYTLSNGETIELAIGSHIRWFGEDVIKGYFAYRRLGESILKRFYERHINREENPYIEKRLDMDFRGFPLLGTIDRYDITPQDTYIITDYKTNKNHPDEHYLKTNFQFTIYSSLFRNLGLGEEEELFIYHLRTGAFFGVSRNEHHFDTLEAKCAEVTEGIEKENYNPRYGFHCNYCDYQKPCLETAVDMGGPKLIHPSEIVDPINYDWTLFEE